jgi:hypothetical protein
LADACFCVLRFARFAIFVWQHSAPKLAMTTKRSQGRYGASLLMRWWRCQSRADYRQVAETSVSQLEKQNDELVDTLAQQVSTLKSVRS